MADATITVSIGAQTASFTVPDAAVQRIIPMVNERWRPYHPGEDPTAIQCFAAGLRNAIRRAVFRYERESFAPEDLEMGAEPESGK